MAEGSATESAPSTGSPVNSTSQPSSASGTERRRRQHPVDLALASGPARRSAVRRDG
jgi:hypothetical protein